MSGSSSSASSITLKSYFIFDKETKQAKCKLCDGLVVHHSSFGNIKRHLRNVHHLENDLCPYESYVPHHGNDVLGLLVEVTPKEFEKHISGTLLEKIRSILLSAIHVQQDSSDDSIPFWKEAYYTLIMLEKLLYQFSSLIFNPEFKDIWETICELLQHRHLWLRKCVLMEPIQMKVVFNFFKLISPKLFVGCSTESPIVEIDLQNYAYVILLPLYKVCEGYAGKIVSDDEKQLAEEVCQCMRKIIRDQNFGQVYNKIRKDLRGRREKRKQGEKISTVVDPMRNAKRKLRLAEKNRTYKKRKVMTMKVGKWRR